jgi:ATP-dependent DNA helicase RecG
LKEGEAVSVRGDLKNVTNIYTKYGKRLTIGKFKDESGEIQLVWFNQQYLKKTLDIGAEYFLSGKVVTFSGKRCFISPNLELACRDRPINTGRLVSIYPETSGITSKWFRSRINDVISIQTTKVFIGHSFSVKSFGGGKVQGKVFF